MKSIYLIVSGLLGCVAPLSAQQIVPGVSADSVRLARSGEYLSVDIDLCLRDLDVESNRAVLLTPRLVNGADSLELASIGIYGRRRYFYYVRNGASMLSEGEQSYRSADKPDGTSCHAVVPYAEWMNGASLLLRRSDYGCCNTLLAEHSGRLGDYEEIVVVPQEPYFPTLAYIRPTAESEKHYSLSGSAFIDFPVDRTEIYPDYRRNTVELAKIQATIDSVRNDRDVRITSVWLKGYASPESPYAHNAELATGRTAALESHIQQLYRFEPGVIVTEFEPEDWEGLRRYVEQSNLAHREQILALIDSDLAPDAKEWRIKSSYPAEYRFLLQNCYPALRHTDYRIDYAVRRFTDVEEIKRVMKSQPQKLSLNEFYLAAQSCETGSDEFIEVFETAVRMYPDDAVANLNAANTAMQRGDLKAAGRYLVRSGESPEAEYARGAYAILSEDYEAAERHLLRAKSAGAELADEALSEIRKRKSEQTDNK
ncbi:MAG: DUF3868 domain-containing protein [Alistipes sp.]|nr:DUF3868 domain-containing protein [Alistipes sp.]